MRAKTAWLRTLTVLLAASVAACTSAVPQASPGTPAPASSADPAGTPSTAPSSAAPGTDPLPTVALDPLPPPMVPVASTPIDRAAEIVGAIRAGGEGGLAALQAAFIESGIPVLGDDGQPVSNAEEMQGLGVEAWEIKLLAGVDAANGAGAVLSDLGDVAMAVDPAFAGDPMGDLILEEIKLAAADSDADVATAANILLQLSLQRDGTDILAAESAADVALDGLQVQLILHRLANDFLILASEPAAGSMGVVLAAARPPTVAVAAPGGGSNPCQYSSSEKRVIGIAEGFVTGQIKGFKLFGHKLENGLLDRFGKAMDGNLTGAEKYARGLKIAGALADIAKMFAALSSLKVDVEMQGGTPLIRTKNFRPGEQKTLVALARLDPGNTQIVNCFRLLFASLGLKFSIPQAETLGDRPISWHGLEGFKGQLVQFRGDPIHQRTDSAGRAQIVVEGVPHRPDVPASAQAVEKSATVRVDVAIKDTSLAGDFSDAIGVAQSGPLAPIKAALELMYRITIPAASFTFPVRDWDTPDYRIDKTVTGSFGAAASWSIRYTGVKCDGPVGEWAIDTTGTLTGGGDTAEIGGTIFVQIAEGSLSGPMGGTARFNDADPGGGQQTEGIFGGTGTFRPEVPELFLDVTSGGGNGYQYGFLDTGIMGPGTLTFPVEQGSFCVEPGG